MTLVIPSGYIQFSIIYSEQNTPRYCSNSMGFPASGALDAQTTDLAQAWADHMGPGSLASNWSVAKFVGTSPAYQYVDTADAFSGSGDQGDQVAHTAALCKLYSELRGRKNRGRLYLPAGYLALGQVAQDGSISDDLLTALNDNFDAFGSAAATISGGQPVILHTHADDTPTVVTNAHIENYVCTQRRRLVRPTT